MADFKQKLGSSTALTCTLNSLAASATVGRSSVEVDNSTDLFLDVMCQVQVTVGTVSGNKQVLIYAYGTVDETNIAYSSKGTDIDGTDKGVTIVEPTMLRGPIILPCPTNSVAHVSAPFSIAAFFGGVMPEKWGLFIANDTGATLSGSGNSIRYRGIHMQSV